MTIDIDSLTVKQVREIAALAGGVCGKRASKVEKEDGEPHVIVRAYSGVFFGRLVARKTGSVELRDVRQIYSWGSAGMSEKSNTCPDIAARGLGTDSKVSSPAIRAIVEQVGAVFFASDAAVTLIDAQKWATR